VQPIHTRAERPATGRGESTRSGILFWVTIVATTAGTISMTTDIIGLFK
jgi:hypothetical protein